MRKPHSIHCRTAHSMGVEPHDASTCDCECHKPTILRSCPRAGGKVQGIKIIELTEDLAAELKAMGHNAEFFTSKRLVPCIKVIILDYRYQVVFFGNTQKFRVFFYDQTHIDFQEKAEVLKYFRNLL